MTIKIQTLDQLREFITWAKDKYTRKLVKHEGGCETCGYGGWSITVGYELDDAALNENLEGAIDQWRLETFGEQK